MSRIKLLFSTILIIIISMGQVGGVLAAPAAQQASPISGTIQSITLESDPTTGVVTVIVAVIDSDQMAQNVRVSQETAVSLGLIVLDGDGNPVINEQALGDMVEIDPSTVIPNQEESQHPVANALATFFSDIQGLDYDAIMAAHEGGVGFGVIAQALWLTEKLGGNSEIFDKIIEAKTTGNYDAFTLEDGTIPQNWGQLRKAILNGDKKNGPGVAISHHDNPGNGNGNANGNGNSNGNNSDKGNDKDKGNNGNSNGNGNGNNKNK